MRSGWRAGFDPRFTSLVLALAAIWIALAVVTDGIFLSPRNLYNPRSRPASPR